MLNSKLKAIIYNVQARDEYSVHLPSYDQCPYEYGGPEQSDHFHCGHPVTTRNNGLKSAYCAEHHALCYKTRRKARA